VFQQKKVIFWFKKTSPFPWFLSAQLHRVPQNKREHGDVHDEAEHGGASVFVRDGADKPAEQRVDQLERVVVEDRDDHDNGVKRETPLVRLV